MEAYSSSFSSSSSSRAASDSARVQKMAATASDILADLSSSSSTATGAAAGDVGANRAHPTTSSVPPDRACDDRRDGLRWRHRTSGGASLSSSSSSLSPSPSSSRGATTADVRRVPMGLDPSATRAPSHSYSSSTTTTTTTTAMAVPIIPSASSSIADEDDGSAVVGDDCDELCDSYLGMVDADDDDDDDDDDDEDDCTGKFATTAALDRTREETDDDASSDDDDERDDFFMEVDSDAVADDDAGADVLGDPMTSIDADANADANDDVDDDAAADAKDATRPGGAFDRKIRAAHAGTVRVVGWTLDRVNGLSGTSTSRRGLRPMHVRVSIRVHHVSFLHPGLDDGCRMTMHDRSRYGEWRFDRRLRGKLVINNVAPSGMLRFGSRGGNWTNPNNPKAIKNPFGGGDGHFSGDVSTSDGAIPAKNTRGGIFASSDNKHAARLDASEVAEIISAEAFRLSRDGIIQRHYALKNISSQSSSNLHGGATLNNRPRRTQSAPTSLSHPSFHHESTSAMRSNLYHSAMLSPYSSKNPQEAARYYRECSERPKGYRRLVVSSAMQTMDLPLPPPPSSNSSTSYTKGYSKGAPHESDEHGSGPQHRTPVADKDSSWGSSRNNENLFDDVEYQYIGPPKTGPDFYRLLRQHGAANFGRYLPEVACSVPNHSIFFEIARTSKKLKRKRCCASTQPFVVEAPHVLWGDARDKALSQIAREGCPLIDSRQFEYVSNARLDDAKYSDSLLVCGATLWVQNAEDDASILSTTSTMKQGLIRAEYYGGKLVDGAKVGVSKGVKGLVVTKKVAFSAAEKGTDEIIKGTGVAFRAAEKGIYATAEEVDPSSPSGSVTSSITHTPSEGRKMAKKKRNMKSLFNPKIIGNKLRRRKYNAGEGGHSIDGSKESLGNPSIGYKSISHDSGQVSGAAKRSVLDVTDEGVSPKSSKYDSNEFMVVKPVPYVLLVDDIIHIRILSFPDKDDVIASFPISVASLMVQRDMDSRMSDPMKPSELTTTFIQEPSAQLLRWGVELKVTMRAVEVKPPIPRVIRTKLRIEDDLDILRNKLEEMGKNPDEIKQELQAREDLLMKEENDLNLAIVHYGYGKGANNGVGQQEIRLRQMFYCDREHIAIARKMDRRSALTDDEKAMVSDTPSMKKEYGRQELQKLLNQLEKEFPVIDQVNASATVRSKTGVDTIQNSYTKTSLALAQSLDSCLGGLTDKSTTLAVERKLIDSLRSGPPATVTKNEMKMWCSQIAEKLSTIIMRVSVTDTDTTARSSIAKIQSIIAESALGPEESFFMDDDENDRVGMKLVEDEFAPSLSKNAVSSDDLRLLADWVNRVASKLQACAQELEEDEEDYEILQSIEHGGRTISRSNKLTSLKSQVYFSSDETGQNHPNDEKYASSELKGSQEPSAMSLSRGTLSYREASSISNLKDALPKSKFKRKSSIESMLIAKEQFHAKVLSENPKENRLRPGAMLTTSSATTLAYFTLVIVFLTGAAAVIGSWHFLWPMFQGKYFNM